MNSLSKQPLSYELPKASPCRICYWGGADTSGASSAIADAQGRAIVAEQQMYEQARADVAPWRTAGGTALSQVGGLLGLPGYTALDPTAVLTGTPGYRFLQDQGTQGLARYGAATGLSLSGPAARSAQNFGQNLAQTYAWAPYMSALQGMSGQGLQAGGLSGNWAMSTGQEMANTYMNAGQQRAQLAIQQANAQNSMMSDLFGGLGFVGSLAAAPFTGGASLIGGLGGLFGGGDSSFANAGYGLTTGGMLDLAGMM